MLKRKVGVGLFFEDNTWQIVLNSWIVTRREPQCIWPDAGNTTDIAMQNCCVKKTWKMCHNITIATTSGETVPVTIFHQ